MRRVLDETPIEPMRCAHPLRPAPRRRSPKSARAASFLTWLAVAICAVAAVAFWYLGGA